jgi:hypothetical protein
MLGFVSQESSSVEMSFYQDTDTISAQAVKHTSNAVDHSPNMDHLSERPMVCWRVHAAPTNLKNEVDGTSNVHYVCVTSFAATEVFSGEEPSQCRLAGFFHL